MLFDGLLDARIAVAESSIGSATFVLMPEETVAMRGAVLSRQNEFAAGRHCARVAMAELGRHGLAVAMGGDRAPIWPDGLVGSISHCGSWCAAAVARIADGFAAIGIDIEAAGPLEIDLAKEICTNGEREWLAAMPEAKRGLLLAAIFSAKEATYKCQYALTGKLIDFQALSIEFDLEDSRFQARFEIDVLPYKVGDTLPGAIRFGAEHITTAVVVQR
ncbi:4'-phosphopantetheinyl transferase superfamily protein (plasmid) [Rhizobium grahamii]|uniref:Enterobactin synthase component D n=1 Tax=Rhizobium grahamii TaxID=1120045 RepID=A0A5Q0C9P6_9HYPH|nr:MULTISPECIES: 4'-phosphopantetheinyl transferase superfamily protein [Rhizobium]QFY62616.1 4'-phosphopantetheinyl transferase superfamily protein [Rhizobium grahamii]QRM52644.1 4'-phosphopantetheinyl transferase superfamily protein [Rhizobium sp. BG6]